MSIVKEAFNKHACIARKQRGRDKTVGASEIGQCARKIWYSKHQKEHDLNYIGGWGAAKRGSVFESRFFVPAMRKHYGDKLLFAGSHQRRLVLGQLSATPDGLLVEQPRDLLAGLMVPDIGPSRCVAVECKSIDPRVNLSEPRTEHTFQVIVQLGLLRLRTQYKPDYGVVIYTNASFFDDTVEFVIRFDPVVFEHARKRADQILMSLQASDLKPEGWIAGGYECNYCPFEKSCMALRGNVPDNDLVAADPQFIAELTDLAIEERTLGTHADEAKRDQREVQEKIKVRLREKGLRFVKSSGISVVWSQIKGRPSYNIPKIKAAATAAGIDIQQYETVGEPSDRLSVTVNKQDRLVVKANEKENADD